jgi:hypothetical protein
MEMLGERYFFNAGSLGVFAVCGDLVKRERRLSKLMGPEVEVVVEHLNLQRQSKVHELMLGPLVLPH